MVSPRVFPSVVPVSGTMASHVAMVEAILAERFPYFAGIVDRQRRKFGDMWEVLFEEDLQKFFRGDRSRLEHAVIGYGRFSLDAMRLQKRFDVMHAYEQRTYAEAANIVYQNRTYMFDLYLPGILLSHFLWAHHFEQNIFFREHFLPRVRSHGGATFSDIGVGTGFYSKEMFRYLPSIHGSGFDLSPFAMEHTMDMLRAWGFAHRYTQHLRDIVLAPVPEPAPFIINVEVLEHLEEPITFLRALCSMMESGGWGFITAAITAPNADHIYLYNSSHEVIAHLECAGFRVVEFIEHAAYEPRLPSDSIPRNGAFIVTT